MSVVLSTTQTLIRYISEWDPREAAHTKGGYLEGAITLPPFTGTLRMIVQTFPAEDVDPAIAALHPVLLHVVRIGKGKRDQELEPVPTHFHWRQVFEVCGRSGEVRILNRVSELDVRQDGSLRNVPPVDVVTCLQDNKVVLGKRRGQLNLILLQPKQRSRAQDAEATVTKVLMDRLEIDDEQEVAGFEKFFKGKNSKNLKRVRLKVDFLSETVDLSVVSRQTIVDSGNKDIGAMDFVDAGPLRSCTKGNRLVVVASEYVLSKDIVPMFQVYSLDQDGLQMVHRPDLELRLRQPSEFEVRNTMILLTTPPQPDLDTVLAAPGAVMKLAVRRRGDGYICSKKFDFSYEPHTEGNCLHCDWEVDQSPLPALG